MFVATWAAVLVGTMILIVFVLGAVLSSSSSQSEAAAILTLVFGLLLFGHVSDRGRGCKRDATPTQNGGSRLKPHPRQLAQRDEVARVVGRKGACDDRGHLDPDQIHRAADHGEKCRVGGVAAGRDPDERGAGSKECRVDSPPGPVDDGLRNRVEIHRREARRIHGGDACRDIPCTEQRDDEVSEIAADTSPRDRVSTAPCVCRLLPVSYMIWRPTHDETLARMFSAPTTPPNSRAATSPRRSDSA